MDIVEAPRRGGRAVGLDEAASEEEGCVGVRPQEADRAVGHGILRMAVAIALEDDPAVALSVFGQLVIAGQRPSRLRGTLFELHAFHCIRTPGGGIVDAAMEDLAGLRGEVAMMLEPLREGEPFGMVLAEVVAVPEHARCLRVAPGEHGDARGIAQGELAISLVEEEPARGQLVEVRRAGEGIPLAAERGLHVVRDDEKDVRLLFFATGAESQQKEKRGDGFHLATIGGSARKRQGRAATPKGVSALRARIAAR